MAARPSRHPRLRRFLIISAIVLGVLLIAVFVGLSFVPGGISHLEVSYRVLPPREPATTGSVAVAPSASAAPGASAVAVESASETESVPGAEPEKTLVLSYTIPESLLQHEVAAIFPITEGVEGIIRLVLSNPRFVADPDPAFLRLRVDIHAIMRDGSGEQYPGFIVVRTQLRYNPGATTVALRNAELAEFQFTGAAAEPAEVLRPVLADELSSQLNGFVVFQLPKRAGWWMRNGMSFVKDVVIENRQVVVLLGL